MNENLRNAIDEIYAICEAHGLNIEVHEDGEHIEIWHDTVDMVDIIFGTPTEAE